MEAHSINRRMLHSATPFVTLGIDIDSPRGCRGAAEIANAFQCLAPLLVPLELWLTLEAVNAELGVAIEPVALPNPHHVIRDSIPEHVQTAPRLPRPSVTECPLSSENIHSWMQNALRSQTSIARETEVAWSYMVMSAAWAYSPTKLAPEFILENLESQPFKIPTRDANGGSWIAGPTANSSISPPLELDITQVGHRTTLSLAVVWPLWSELGSPGQRLLAATVARLRQQGWELERADEIFVAL